VGNGIVTGLSYHPLPNRQNAIRDRPSGLNRDLAARNKTAGFSSRLAGYLMRRFILLLWLLTAALYPAPSSAQQRNQLGPLCTTDTTPADQQIDACNKIIALKVFSGEKLATIYFWRAVGWNKKGNYVQVIADASEAIRLAPNVPSYNLRGSAYYDKGEYDIAIADFNDALRMGPPSGIIHHNRGNAYRSRATTQKPLPTTTRRSSWVRSRRFPTRTAAHRNRRSAISMARLPTSKKPSGSIPHCPRR
jgi:tetratricopeptide (TPR) repeat protein